MALRSSFWQTPEGRIPIGIRIRAADLVGTVKYYQTMDNEQFDLTTQKIGFELDDGTLKIVIAQYRDGQFSVFETGEPIMHIKDE